ncbi:MAG TPA: uridine diphosphate-N-acetylglucosamine-binding protein YvcK [Thermoanaerobaculia bacterium]|nr:uridine diphosphate-N-acetylglucosamine-binding protein YvcK [Thermoanaerobaculia bacterium]
MRVVGIGGGSGLSSLLRGLSDYSCAEQVEHRPGLEITGVVSVADDGGSSGLLRDDLAIPAVGDLRNCIVALSQDNPLWAELFQHRFLSGNGLAGHALGNLIVAALVQRSGGLQAAVELLARPMQLAGQLLPVTEERVSLCAKLASGEVVCGESQIRERRGQITDLWLEPGFPAAGGGVLDAIAAADAIVLGPGSLFTSALPNLLVAGVADAIRSSGALRIFVCNLITEPGETDGFDAADHLMAIERYLGVGAVDVCVVNNASLPAEAARRYAANGSTAVCWEPHLFSDKSTVAVAADLLATVDSLGRHDSAKLARVIVSLATTLRRQSIPCLPPSGLRAHAALDGSGLRVA